MAANIQIQIHIINTEKLRRDHHDHLLKRNTAFVTSSIDSGVTKTPFLEPRLYWLDECDSQYKKSSTGNFFLSQLFFFGWGKDITVHCLIFAIST